MPDASPTALRILSWNIAHSSAAWATLQHSDVAADVALLQEAIPPGPDVHLQTIPSRDEPWVTSGGRRNFCAAVARLSDRVQMSPVACSPLMDQERQQMGISRLGSLAVADIAIDGEAPITVVSMYSAWEQPREGSWIYADASAHRLVSDLSYLVGSQRGHRIIVSGDLNILYGHAENGSRYWKERYATVFSRMEAIGLPFVGPQYPHGVQADRWPSELPVDSSNVPTFRVRRSDPSSATRQLDFVFVSESLRNRVHVRALNSVAEWGPSDHCRVLIELR